MDLFKKSTAVLKNLQLDNGGILSTPLNGAYPYIYPRDAVIVTKAFNKVGLCKNSEKFYYFMNKFARIDKFNEIFQRYHAEGWPCVTRKHENDTLGLVVHGIYDTYVHSKNTGFLENMWPFVCSCIASIFSHSRTGLIKTERSIHEFYRLEHGYEIWANTACCRALYDATEIANVLGHKKEEKKWRTKAKELESNIKKRMFSKKLNVFIKNTRFPDSPDISQLSPFYFSIIDSKPILRKTMNYLRKNIWHKELAGFRRFRRFEICNDWHWYTGGSGSWVPFTMWGARFYKELGEQEKSRECLKWVEKSASKTNGLLPEHVATRDEYEMWKANETEFNVRVLSGMKHTERFASKLKEKLMFWALPLAWSHAEYVIFKKTK